MSEFVTGKITYLLFEEPVELEVTVPKAPVTLTRMLPIFQGITNDFVNMSEDNADQLGGKVSCQKGCGACCRQAVPIAEVEAYQLAELVENMPEPRRTEIKRKFAEGVKHFHDNKWFERMENYPNLSTKERETVVMEYFYDDIACPFLEDESCGIHLDRPLSCREYLVTSPAENCQNPTAKTIKMLPIPAKASKSLQIFGTSEKVKNLVFLPLIRAMEWAEENPIEMNELPAEVWMKEFFTYLKQTKF